MRPGSWQVRHGAREVLGVRRATARTAQVLVPLQRYAETRRIPPFLRATAGFRTAHLDCCLDEVDEVTGSPDGDVRRAADVRTGVLGARAVAAVRVPLGTHVQRQRSA